MLIKNIQKTISLNKYRNTNYFTLNSLKKEFAWFVLDSLKGKKERFVDPVKLIFTFGGYRKRDIDGEMISVKFTLDALVDLGILIDDSPKYVREITSKVGEDGVKTFDVEIIKIA